MKLDYDYDVEAGLISLTFYVKELTKKSEQEKCLYLVEALSAEYDIDPEVTLEDLSELLKDCKTEGKDSFTVDILEDGVEFFINQD